MNNKKASVFPDPFEDARKNIGYAKVEDQDDDVMMLLRHKDVKTTAHDCVTFKSGVEPGRIVVPSEVHIRDTRQIPFEVDPPQHTEYRATMEAWFKRPMQAEYQEKLKIQIEKALSEAMAKESVEIINEFALPLQSRALTLLLNTPLEEAEKWIAWGTHVFRSEGDALDASKANVLYDYIDAEIDKAIENPGEDLYSMLLNADFQGRKLNKEEVKGAMILTFAGGRDTVINAVSNALAYFAENPNALLMLKEKPNLIGRAVEELVRYFAPLTHMGRVVAQDTTVCEHAAKADTRVSLCWASANRDETVFENPNEVILDRKVNPHVGFGFSHHNCLGAAHARQVLKILIGVLVENVSSMTVLDYEENIEDWGAFKRKVGFHRLVMGIA